MTTPLAPEALRRICPPENLPFENTEVLESLEEIAAQDGAIRPQPGRARVFKSDCERLIEDFKTGIPHAFATEAYEQQKDTITRAAEKEQGKELEGLKERVETVGQGQFPVYPVRIIDEGIALLTGVPAGEEGPDGAYPKGTVNFLVQRRLKELAERAKSFRGNGEPASGRPDDAGPTRA